MSHFRARLFLLALLFGACFSTALADTFTTGGYYSGNQNDFVNGFITFSLGGQVQSGAAGNIAGSYAVINGVKTPLLQVFCVDLADDIYLNTTYNATYNNTGVVKGSTVNNDGKIAWLLLNRAPLDQTTADNEGLQAAIWSVEYSTFSLITASNDPAVVAAYNADLAALGNNTANVASLEWITPVNSDNSFAQAQVGLAATPEPASLCLLGTGLSALGALARLRRRRVQA